MQQADIRSDSQKSVMISTRHAGYLVFLCVVCRRVATCNAEFLVATRHLLLGQCVLTARAKTGCSRRRRWWSYCRAVRAWELFVVGRVWKSATEHYVDVLVPLRLLLLQQSIVLRQTCAAVNHAYLYSFW